MALYGIIAFIIYGWVEFEAMAHVVDAIGGLLAFIGIFVTAIIGIHLLRSQSQIVMAQFRKDIAKGNVKTSAIASSLSLLCGALLMLIPGYVTDGIGLLCFVPGLREIIGAAIATRFSGSLMANASRFSQGGFSQGGFSQGGFQQGGFSGFGEADRSDAYQPRQKQMPSSDDIIEGEFKEKK